MLWGEGAGDVFSIGAGKMQRSTNGKMTNLWSAVTRAQPLHLTLCLHGVGQMPPARSADEKPYWLPESELKALLASLERLEARHGVRIRFDFDDGNESDHAVVLPLLKEFSRRAAFFMPTDWIGQPGRMSVQQIKDLVHEGMVLGSHGTDHAPWTDLTDNALSRQLRHSKRVLEQIGGRPVSLAAAPYGLWSPRVASAVMEAGYEHLHTCAERPCKQYGLLNHRFTVRRGDDVDALLSRKLRVLRRAVHKAKDLRDRIVVQAA